MAHVGIVVGHSEDTQGAVGVDGVSEWVWNTPVAMRVQTKLTRLGHSAKVYFLPNSGGYIHKQMELTNKLNEDNCACVVSLHFNAIGNTVVTGTEVLHWPGSERGEALAKRLSRRVSEALRVHNRGAVPQSRSWNSSGPTMLDDNGTPMPSGPTLFVLQWTAMPAVILESHFGTNKRDRSKANAARDAGRLSDAITSAIDDWIRVGEFDNEATLATELILNTEPKVIYYRLWDWLATCWATGRPRRARNR